MVIDRPGSYPLSLGTGHVSASHADTQSFCMRAAYHSPDMLFYAVRCCQRPSLSFSFVFAEFFSIFQESFLFSCSLPCHPRAAEPIFKRRAPTSVYYAFAAKRRNANRKKWRKRGKYATANVILLFRSRRVTSMRFTNRKPEKNENFIKFWCSLFSVIIYCGCFVSALKRDWAAFCWTSVSRVPHLLRWPRSVFTKDFRSHYVHRFFFRRTFSIRSAYFVTVHAVSSLIPSSEGINRYYANIIRGAFFRFGADGNQINKINAESHFHFDRNDSLMSKLLRVRCGKTECQSCHQNAYVFPATKLQ